MPKLLLPLLFVLAGFNCPAKAAEHIQWVSWSDDIFVRAQKENKFVLLNLEAIWCHWCHVMEKETYSNPKVMELIKAKYIAVKVDQDSHPGLSKRYEDYGWPATIFFQSNGTEILKRSGFIQPARMISILQGIIDDPSPVKMEASPNEASKENFLPKELKAQVEKANLDQFDKKQGGWGFTHKFLYGEPEELSMKTEMSKKALTKALVLIDPAWGGSYQYSVKTWQEPHYEKIALTQGNSLYLYSLGFGHWNDPKFLKASNDIYRYLNSFLSDPEGGFYTSQDADLIKGKHSEDYFKLGDSARRKLGIPAVDKNIYAKENGAYISALARYYATTLDPKILERAIKAANFIIKNRTFGEGGFKHGTKDVGGPYLGDTLEMGFAFLRLYEVTADSAWLDIASKAANFMKNKFDHKINGVVAGFKSSASPLSQGLESVPTRDENVKLVRFTNLLNHYTGDESFRKMAEQGMRYLTIPSVATDWPAAAVLIANSEISLAPLHLTVIGSKKDPQALALFQEMQKIPSGYKRIDWIDRSDKVQPRQDVKYPELEKAAAFVCTAGRCSLPIYATAGFKEKVDKLQK